MTATVEAIGAFEAHAMPSGVVVYYRDSDHSYWSGVKTARNGDVTGTGRLTGVTTVVAPYDWRPDNLMRWAARLNGEGVAALAADGLSLDDAEDMRAALRWLETGESVWSALADARLLYSDARDDAATRGTNVHKHALHALATGAAVPDLGALADAERGYALGVAAFWLDHEPQPICSEQVVGDLKLNVAGRLDMIATMGAGEWRGQTLVVDAKTSTFLPTKHHAQLAGYRGMAVNCGVVPALDGGLILQVDADGGYELVPVTATWRDFVVAVDLYRRAARIGRASNAARKARAA